MKSFDTQSDQGVGPLDRTVAVKVLGSVIITVLLGKNIKRKKMSFCSKSG